LRHLLAALPLLLAAPLPAAAEQLSAAETAVEHVALIDGWREPDGSRVAAIEIRLAPGWHTYWRVPGSVGIPPSFDWSQSRNLASVAYDWPRPTFFDTAGGRSFGYDGALVLPVRLVPADPSAPLDVHLALDFGVCNDICVPAEAHLDARLTPETAPAGRARIEAALAEGAQGAGEAGVTGVTCALAQGDGGYALTARITFGSDPGPGQVAVLEPGQPDLWIGEAESLTDGRTLVARAPVAGRGKAGPVVERQNLRLTVLDDRRAVDIQGCAGPG